MKFAALALLLGCSALACKYAVQSNSFDILSTSSFAEFPDVRSALEDLRFSFRPLGRTLAASTLVEPRPNIPVAPIPRLPKAETLVLIAGAAARHHVPAAFVQSIVAAESNFDCAAISPKGAIGLMQLMPETAQQFGVNPRIPAENIDAGTRYLRWLMSRYQKNGGSLKHVIAAYNAGPGMVDRYHGIPPFRETRQYVTRVVGYLKKFGGASKQFRG